MLIPLPISLTNLLLDLAFLFFCPFNSFSILGCL